MRWLRKKRPGAPVEPRKNQWRGSQVERCSTHDADTLRMNAVARRKAMARWGALAIGVILTGWIVMEGVKYSGSVMQHVFEVRTITVEGLHRVDKQEVIDRARLKIGMPLHHVMTTMVKEQIESHPWVKEAIIDRVPFHELRISVTERKPAAIIRTDSQNFLCDEEGHVLTRLGQTDDDTFPLVTGIDAKGLLQGNESARQAIIAGIELAQLVGQTLEGRLQVNAENRSNLVASIRGVRFHFGEGAFGDRWERFQLVKPTLKTLKFDGQGHGPNEIDLRYENRIIVREGG